MKIPSMNSDIESALLALQSARMAAAAGDSSAAEGALVDAYNRISRMLKSVQAHERKHVAKARENVTLWRERKRA